jgi:hypothetical protein
LEGRISSKKLLCKSESTMNLNSISFFCVLHGGESMLGLSVSSLLAPQFYVSMSLYPRLFILQLGIVVTVQTEPTRSVEVVSIWILTHSSYWLCFGHYIRSWISSFLQPRPRYQLIFQLPLGYHLSNILCTILFYWSWLV